MKNNSMKNKYSMDYEGEFFKHLDGLAVNSEVGDILYPAGKNCISTDSNIFNEVEGVDVV